MDADFSECAHAAKQMVDRAFIRALTKPRPLVIVAATATLWAQIVVAWAVALYGNPLLIPLAFVVMCAVAQGMLLWTHEASHFSLFPNKRLNDLWCDLFFAGPVGISVAAYRAKHMTHHAHLGTDKDEDGDPYHFNVKGKRQLTLFFLKTLSGIVGAKVTFQKYLGAGHNGAPAQHITPRWLSLGITLVFNLGLLGLCISAVAVGIALNVVRTVAEHQPEDYPHYVGQAETAMRPISRTTVPSFLEKWLLYQANFNYHVEHHLFPQVPQHNLKLLHDRLRSSGFYEEFPDALQTSGIAKFFKLSRNTRHDDFSDAIEEAAFG